MRRALRRRSVEPQRERTDGPVTAARVDHLWFQARLAMNVLGARRVLLTATTTVVGKRGRIRRAAEVDRPANTRVCRNVLTIVLGVGIACRMDTMNGAAAERARIALDPGRTFTADLHVAGITGRSGVAGRYGVCAPNRGTANGARVTLVRLRARLGIRNHSVALVADGYRQTTALVAARFYRSAVPDGASLPLHSAAGIAPRSGATRARLPALGSTGAAETRARLCQTHRLGIATASREREQQASSQENTRQAHGSGSASSVPRGAHCIAARSPASALRLKTRSSVVRDAAYDTTPVGWAEHAGARESAEILRAVGNAN
jgi:hypothetical protein